MKKIKITDLLIFIVGTELVGVLSGIIAGGSFSFYKEIVRPPFSPPGWIFPIVWIILYALMGISAYLIYTSKATVRQKNFALAVYAIQLVVNFLWSIVFFRLEMVGLSVIIILLLLLLIFVTVAYSCYDMRFLQNPSCCRLSKYPLFALDSICIVLKYRRADFKLSSL